jgi:hypothetical protein
MNYTQTILSNSGNKALKLFIGGGIVSHSIRNENLIEIFLLTLLVIIIKAFIVMVCYNAAILKLITNFKPDYDPNKFRKINIWESILLILLFSNLFGRY